MEYSKFVQGLHLTTFLYSHVAGPQKYFLLFHTPLSRPSPSLRYNRRSVRQILSKITLSKIDEYYSFVDEISKPLGQLLVAQVFLILGYRKVIYYDETAGRMEDLGISSSFSPLVIVVEIFGSLCLILGWKTRVCAILLCGYCFLTAVLFHMNFLDPMQQISL